MSVLVYTDAHDLHTVQPYEQAKRGQNARNQSQVCEIELEVVTLKQ